MARLQQIMFSNCTDPGREEEFNRWYSHTHLPDLSKAEGFIGARRFRNALPNRGSARYMAVYEFESDNAEKVLRDLTLLALDAFDRGRHIDCIEGCTAGNTPLGAQWLEIDPNSLTPLAEHAYPPATPFIRRQMLGLMRALDTPGRYAQIMNALTLGMSTQLLLRLMTLWTKLKAKARAKPAVK